MSVKMLLILLALMPLYYGGVYVWNWAAASIFIGLHAVFLTVQLTIGRELRQVPFGALKWALVCYILVLFWMVLQWSSLSPEAWHHSLWRASADVVGIPYAGHISVDPYATYEAGLKLITYAVMMLITIQVGRTARNAYRGFIGLLIIIAVYSGFGLFAWLLDGAGFLWFDESALSGQLTVQGRMALPFVNANHLAAYTGMGLIICSGLMLKQYFSFVGGVAREPRGIRRFLLHLMSEQAYLPIAFVLLSTVLLLTQSRAGVFSVAVGLLTLIVGSQRASLLGVGVKRLITSSFVVFGLTTIYISYDQLVGRFVKQGVNLDLRGEIYEQSFALIQASPWLGYGAGSYPTIARMYGDREATYVLGFAHSTVLENVVELGAPGAFFLFLALGILMLRCWKGIRLRNRNQIVPIIGFAICVQMLLHSLVDFPLQVPAIGMTFCFVLALGFSQSISERYA